MLSSLWLVCVVLALAAREHWSEVGATKTIGSDYNVCNLFFSPSSFNSLNLGKESYSVLLCSRSRWI
jgi:hypothetical protein